MFNTTRTICSNYYTNCWYENGEINPSFVLGYTGVRQPLENMPAQTPAAQLARVRLRNFCLQAKDQAFLPLDGFPGETGYRLNEISGINEELVGIYVAGPAEHARYICTFEKET
jgi:hypothetical protein